MITTLLVGGLLGRSSAAAPVTEALVEVHRDRVLLGDLWRGASPAYASLDLGASPAPGSTRIYLRRELGPRLARQGVDVSALPERIVVRRTGQRIDEATMHALAASALAERLPPGFVLGEVKLPRVMWAPPGELTVTSAPLAPRLGHQAVRLELSAAGVPVRRLSATVELEGSADAAALARVARGQRIVLRVAVGAVVAALGGVAQQDGRTGERVAVVADTGRKLLQGIVAPDGVVEVEP